MQNFGAREYQGRVTIDANIVHDPENVVEATRKAGLTAAKRAVHHSGHRVGSAMMIHAADGTYKMVSGSNYTPTPAHFPRACAEKAQIKASRAGDVFCGFAALVLDSRQDRVLAGNERKLPFLVPCTLPCRDILRIISPKLVVATYRMDSPTPEAVYTIGELDEFTAGELDYPWVHQYEFSDHQLALFGAVQWHKPIMADLSQHAALHRPAVPRPAQ